ncbi:MFS transporter [Microbacterium sp. JZ31]|uniref:MFS transporter n=1 Tax=Microbacterium sp. JZ31 TaxID=1906274 RepID=UPI0019335A78|nr:MFS transporter [Microbacterium sp. JZ31]
MSSAPSIRRRTLRGHPIATLISVSFGLFMVGLDATVVHIANPAIAADLGTSFAELQWITNAYLLGIAVFLILGGQIGDRFGRRTTYAVGVIAFALASIAIGLVGSTAGVIAFRAVQGVSAAVLMPQTIALLRATFPRERFGMAVGIWGGVSSLAIAAGPIVGGALVQSAGWESIFFLNAPIAAIAVVMSALVLTESKASSAAGRFDIPGVLLLALGLAAVIVGIVQSETWGWASAFTIGALVLGIALLGLFVLVEARTKDPLLPLSLFRAPGFAVGGVAIAVNFFAMMGVTFFLTLFLVNVRGAEGLLAGVMLLPMSAVSIVASPVGAVLVSRIGARRTMALGLGMVAVAFAALTAITAESPYVGMAIPFVVLSLGVGFTMTAGAEAIVGSAPVHLAGVAGGFQSTMLQLGGALGTAVFAAIVTAGSRAGSAELPLTDGERDGVSQGIVPAHLSATDAATALNAFLGGFHAALITAAVLAAVVAVLALVALGKRPRPTAAEVREETVEAGAGHA